MALIGRLNKLDVVKEVDFGVYLDGEQYDDILLPKRYVPEGLKIGDEIEVFLYLDSEDRYIATTERPYAMAGEFAYLKVDSVSSFGAFLSWGLPKDLLAPKKEQQTPMEQGRSYVVRIYVDDKSVRLAASSRLDKYLDKRPHEFEAGMEVNILISHKTDLGYKAIVNNSHWGVLYENEIFKPVKIGDKVKAYIKKIRDDFKIDLTLHQPGYEKVDGVAGKILRQLEEKGGFIPITDKSSPEDIYGMFGESKKTFKKAVGALYKKRFITLEKNGIKLSGKSYSEEAEKGK